VLDPRQHKARNSCLEHAQDAIRLFNGTDRSWELLTKADVESRLGIPVTELSRDRNLRDLDLTTVEHWVCIPATVKYTVWSDVYKCEGFISIEEPTGKISRRGKNTGKPIISKSQVARGYGRTFTLWEVAVNLDIGEIANRFTRPYCYQAWEKRQLQKSGETAVLVTYEYEGFVTNAQGKVSFKAIRKDRFPTRREFRTLEEITSRRIHEWHPTQTLDMGREMMRHGMAKQSLSTIADFWTPRNRRAMATLWAIISRTASKRVRRALYFTFTAIVFRVSRRRIVYCPKGGGWASTVISGTLYIPSLNAEANVRDSLPHAQLAFIWE